MKKQIISILFAIILIFALKNTCNAASANISCNTSATVGEEITISANVTGVMWKLELKVNGETIAQSSELDNVEGNKTVTFSGKYKANTEGTLNVTLAGSVTEFSDGKTIRDFESKTITVNAIPATTTPSTPSTPTTPGTTTAKSSEARLSNLGIKPNDFKGFKRDKTTYTTEVPNSVSEVEVYAKTVHKNAKVTGTGKVSLKEGDNVVKVTVTAEDGKTTKTYTLTITRKKAEEENKSEARLSNLGINPKEYDFSGFKRDTTTYSVEVPNELEEIEIYANAVSSKAKITGTGKVLLKEGENTANIEVTAEDGTKKTYTIKITRKAAETTNETPIETEEPEEPAETDKEVFGLETLTIKDLNISPKFDSETYEYTVSLTKDLSKLEIDAKSNDSDATIEVIGNENLQDGENIITILVNNEETGEYATYQIIVNKSVMDIVTIDKVDWTKPYTWTLKERIIVGALIVFVIIVIVAVIIKIKLSRQKSEEVDLPGADELDKAMSEHQELTDDTEISQNNYEEIKINQNNYEEKAKILDEFINSDSEQSQEDFAVHTKRKGKHF